MVLQACFQVPRITRLLESSIHPHLVSLRSLCNRYKGGTGPLTIGTLSSLVPPDMKSRFPSRCWGNSDSHMCPLRTGTYDLSSGSRRNIVNQHTNGRSHHAFSQSTSCAQDSDNLIFQFGRSDLVGSMIRQHITYPMTLDVETYRLAIGRPMMHPLSLQTVIVHQGHVFNKEHYVIFIKLTDRPGCALSDDDKVHWVLPESPETHSRGSV